MVTTNHQIKVSVQEGSPVHSVRAVRDYDVLFWRPLLGARVFDAYQVLLTYRDYEERTGMRVTISLLSDTLALGDRYTLLGRAATSSRPEQRGVIAMLEEHGIVEHQVEEDGRHTLHHFVVKPHLPRLKSEQIEQLSKRKQKEHRRLLEQAF